MSLPLADELLVHLATPDRRGAAAHSAGLVEGGLSLHELVDDGLAPAMGQVGKLWEAAVWTVSDEHLATSAAEAALSSAANAGPVTGARGDLVVACTEGDWHSLPARMIAEVLQAEGWSVRFLGASQPTRLMVEYLTRNRPDAVLLSCAVPMALPALVGAVHALHAMGLPVLVGGHALTARRAGLVGADGYGATAAATAALLERLPEPARGAADNRLLDYETRQSMLPGWVAAGMLALDELMPTLAAAPADIRSRTAADLHHLLDTACIALLLDDPELMDEQCDWLTRVLTARGVPGQALTHGLSALSRARPSGEHVGAVNQVLQQQHARLLHRADERQSPMFGGAED